MKNIVIIFAVVLAFGLQADARQIAKEKEQSNLERFSSKSGTVIERTVVGIGSLRGVRVQAIFILDLTGTGKTQGVRLEYDKTTRLGSDTKTAYLDSDEIDGYIQTLNLLKEKILPSKRLYYTEIIFGSRGGFQSGAVSIDGVWKIFMQLEKYDSDSFVTFFAEDIGELLGLLQKAKQRLVFGLLEK